MRSPPPPAMVWFDRLYFVLIACNLLLLFIGIPKVEQQTFAEGGQVGAVDFSALASALAFTMLQLMALWFFASRWRSQIAKWLITILTVGTALSNVTKPHLAVSYGPAVAILTIAGVLLGLACAICLHLPESRAWFAQKRALRA